MVKKKQGGFDVMLASCMHCTQNGIANFQHGQDVCIVSLGLISHGSFPVQHQYIYIFVAM